MSEPTEHDVDGGINRRDAIKKAAVGATAAGVVWAAPKVQGLTLRPNYAAAQTGPGTVMLTFDINMANTAPTQMFACTGTNFTANLAYTPGVPFGTATATVTPLPNPASVAVGTPTAAGGFLASPMVNSTANSATVTGIVIPSGAGPITITVPYNCL